VNVLLKPLELLWRVLNRGRRMLYRTGVLKARRLPVPVISIGNIAAGGTGKTPAVVTVCRELTARGLKVAVLTRGYGRGPGAADGLVTSLDPVKFGDEPVLIKSAVNVEVIVGHNRFKNASEYLKTNNCDVFVLDDGFQHLQLHRDLDVVIDAPARVFREGRSALRHAGIVIPRRIRTSVPSAIAGRLVFAFAGLGSNLQFFASLREAGLELAGTREFPDHHRYTPGDLEALQREATGLPLVTSRKDAVKLGGGAKIHVADLEFLIDAKTLDRIEAAARGERPKPERRRKRRKGKWTERFEYLAYRLVSRGVRSLTDAGVRRWGTRLGNAARRLLRGRDRVMMRNLRYVYPDRSAGELRRLANECWRHFGREALVSVRMQSMEPDEILAGVTITGAELVDQALERGNGVVLLSAHWGSWEVAGIATMSVVPRLRTVARALDNELLERDVQRLREKLGAEIIDRRNAARALLRGIAGNGAVAMIPDQAVQPREGVLVPFLRRPAWTTPAPAKLAVRANATIVFAFCIPDGLGYRLVFENPIRTDLLTESERDSVVLTGRINEIFSKRIDERPELWLWMHDRWKWTEESGPSDVA
jgi:tetraacyldisaccharide-1-P 4'-kinase/lauroyl/myristoyl acyltransferase